jgi:hypothetical protein
MKKALIYFTLISMTWLSCKKDKHDQTKPQSKLYSVTFTVANFTQENSSTNQNKTHTNAVITPDQTNILWLVYKLFDSQNKLVNNVKVKKGQPAFGTIKDNLAPGNYQAAFIGIVDTVHYNDLGNSFVYNNVSSFGFSLADTYYKKVNFTVGNDYLQQSVVLQRLTSQIQVVIKDIIPPGVTSMNITINNLGFAYDCLADTTVRYEDEVGIPSSFTTTVPPNKIGTTNFNLDLTPNLLNPSSPVTIILSALNSGKSILAQKTIYNIQLQPNTRTTITGNLFTGSNSGNNSGFSVNFDQTSNPDINQNF